MLCERHVRFVRRLAAFAVVASQAGGDEVLPRVLAAAALRHDVIDGEHDAGESAIHTLMSIAPQDIFARENDLLERHANIGRETNHAWEWHRDRSRMHGLSRHRADKLRFLQIH